ncbi:tRNA modification GTPase [Humisphaera borealis]|uniref:tRNA modification GTPase MnmE n=1 Tax=Humisphaera borealis TaxID=2807512 RepID=A0A7M2X090_9BACT|nr:GTPase [Humisphaera borealis]QOV91178.1 50S ribosome-binding GTPase [Humisphaera borealis]
MNSDETIVAVSSAVGSAARMIVRTSGPAALTLLADLVRDPVPADGGSAFPSHLAFSGVFCPAWVYVFRSPASYSGEDLVEYHLPGNPVLVEMFVSHLRGRHDLQIRAAEPGEFTARAYFNGRMDLTQAEGVAAVVAAQSEQQEQAGRRLMAGELARRIREPADLILATLALVEVGIDFSDEDVTFLPIDDLLSRIDQCRNMLSSLLSDSARFKPLGYEPTLILVGRPNAGKSTLLNALAGYERAVASATAGTTRDALTARIALERGYVRVVDVAGLEEGLTVVGDDIKSQMTRRALDEIARADRVILVVPVDDAALPVDAGRVADLVVRTKCDTVPAVAADASQRLASPPGPIPTVAVSALTGQGMDALRRRLDEQAFGRDEAATLTLNARHEAAILAADQALVQVRDLVEAGGAVELVAAELWEVLAQTGRVLGQVTPDEILDEVFSRFCIGK